MVSLISFSQHFHHFGLGELMSFLLGQVHRVHRRGCSCHRCLLLGPFWSTSTQWCLGAGKGFGFRAFSNGFYGSKFTDYDQLLLQPSTGTVVPLPAWIRWLEVGASELANLARDVIDQIAPTGIGCEAAGVPGSSSLRQQPSATFSHGSAMATLN